jgi:hypothetical protein
MSGSKNSFAARGPGATAVLFVLEPYVISNLVRRYNRAIKAASVATEPITTAFDKRDIPTGSPLLDFDILRGNSPRN